jgi:toxin ParE1/3/4
MGWKIDWTQPALDDLAEVVAFIAADDPDAAVRVGDKIIDHVEVLSSFPEIGPIYRRRPKGDVRQILSSPFRIYYRISRQSNLVEILHVWHAARREPADM